MAGLRVVLDTNVLVSGIAYPESLPGRILGAWRRGGVDVVLSRYILDEMVRVLPRLKRVTLNAAEIRGFSGLRSETWRHPIKIVGWTN